MTFQLVGPHFCPRCGSFLIRRTHPTGWIERFAWRFMFFWPYRWEIEQTHSFQQDQELAARMAQARITSATKAIAIRAGTDFTVANRGRLEPRPLEYQAPTIAPLRSVIPTITKKMSTQITFTLSRPSLARQKASVALFSVARLPIKRAYRRSKNGPKNHFSDYATYQELTEALSHTRRIISSVRLEDLNQFVANGGKSVNSDEVSGQFEVFSLTMRLP